MHDDVLNREVTNNGERVYQEPGYTFIILIIFHQTF